MTSQNFDIRTIKSGGFSPWATRVGRPSEAAALGLALAPPAAAGDRARSGCARSPMKKPAAYLL